MFDVWTGDSNVVSFALLLSILVILPVFLSNYILHR